ncbi:MAG: 2OG-Fe(II) oxygenase [Pseudomonadota bacterium]
MTSLPKLDWAAISNHLNEAGVAVTGPLLAPEECDGLRGLYADDGLFRSKVDMRRHGFGQGEYKYFSNPLPDLVQTLRSTLYPHLAKIANGWMAALGRDLRYPETLSEMLDRCRAAGQTRPTPLLLKYGPGDYNCLHQDLYGAEAFPIQLVLLLDRPGEDFTGGEFVLTEQRPRMQSRAEVVPLAKGHGAFFAVNERPRQGTKGVYRVKMRHGVSRLRTGKRHTLGIIFHDAA